MLNCYHCCTIIQQHWNQQVLPSAYDKPCDLQRIQTWYFWPQLKKKDQKPLTIELQEFAIKLILHWVWQLFWHWNILSHISMDELYAIPCYCLVPKQLVFNSALNFWKRYLLIYRFVYCTIYFLEKMSNKLNVLPGILLKETTNVFKCPLTMLTGLQQEPYWLE